MKQDIHQTLNELMSAQGIVYFEALTNSMMHNHICYEFSITVDDGYYQIINGKRVDVKSGDVILLRPTDIHQLCLKEDSDAAHKAINILIPADLFEDVCNQLSSSLFDAISGFAMPIKFSVSKSTIKGLEQRYQSDLYSPTNESWRIDKLNKFYIIRRCAAYEWIGRIIESGLVDNAVSYSTCIQKIVDLLSDPENLKLSVGAIIKKSFFSSSYISHQFKNQFGIKFEDYIAICRVKEAEKLLRTTNISIDQISKDIGWKSTSSFINKFKEVYGMTPAKFRNYLKKL